VHPSLLFVQSAVSGSYDGTTLTIKDEPSLILYFSDRPERFIGHMTGSRFLRLWSEGKDNFKANPPNAVLSVLSEKKVNNVTLELLSPVVEGNTWKYAVKVLSGELPKNFGAASLFIDAFPAVSGDTNKKALGDAPAIAMGNLYQSTSQSLANVSHSTAPAQQQVGASTVFSTPKGK